MQEMQETRVQSLGQEDTLEGEMATQSTVPPGKPSKYRYHLCKQIIQIVFNEIYLSYFKSKRIFSVTYWLSSHLIYSSPWSLSFLIHKLRILAPTSWLLSISVIFMQYLINKPSKNM